MAILQKQKGKYWYIIKSVRINGKPRPKILAYLGKAEDILEKLQGKKPVSSKSYEYGTAAVLAHFIEKLNIINIFNNTVFPKGCIPKHNGLNFGETMAAIIIHRALHPSSKRSFGEWAERTFLPQMYKFDSKKITSQHFWDMMDMMTIEQIHQIEKELTANIIKTYKIKLDLLLYDYTNFFTFIDTNNQRNSLAQRGKNKQKRNDLRQFCLALLVVREHRIPLFSDIYEGNKNDSSEFSDSIDNLQQRITELSGGIEDITIVFDKGNNSRDNFKALKELNYVASFSIEHNKELKHLPYSKFYDLKLNAKNDKKVQVIKCYRRKMTIWDKERTVVLYKSMPLFEGQLAGLKNDLKNIKTELAKLKISGENGFYLKKLNQRKPWTYELFERQVEQTINKRFVRDIIDYKITELKNSCFGLIWEINKKKHEEIKKTCLGKRILITSRNDWSDEEIISAYHGQIDVEKSFRQIKNPFHNCVRPQYHWTDQKIQVHTFCSLLSLTISSLIEMKAKENGFSYSINDIYYRLSELRKAKYVYSSTNKKDYEIEYKIEEVDDPQNIKLFDCLMK